MGNAEPEWQHGSGQAVEGFMALRAFHISTPLSPSYLSLAGLAI